MTAVASSYFRKHFSESLRMAESKPLEITRSSGEGFVLMSESEYSSLLETLHLLSSPENARLLNEGIAAAGRGEFVEMALIR